MYIFRGSHKYLRISVIYSQREVIKMTGAKHLEQELMKAVTGISFSTEIYVLKAEGL